MCIAVQIQYSAAYKVEFLWQITINMQHEDQKNIQHKIQYTVAQCRELAGIKDQMNRNLKKDGVTWYLCYYVSTTVLSLSIYIYNIT